MNGLARTAVSFGIAFAIVVIATRLVRRLAFVLGAVAHPSRDRWRQDSVPMLGGVAIYAGVVGAVLLSGAYDPRVGWALTAGSLMFLVGLLDDFVRLRPTNKLLAQILVACAVTFGMGPTEWLGLPVLDGLLAIIWIVAITNALNLLDNMDGLCAGVAAIVAIAFTASTFTEDAPQAAAAAALAGAACGFLLYNFHPASIFMGDAGSLFLGATLGVMSITAARGQSMGVLSALAFPVLLLLIPLFDAAFVTISRKLSARRASVGGRDHTSHRLVAMGFSERHAVLLLYLFAAAGGASAVVLRRASAAEGWALTGVVLVGLCLLGVRLARVTVYGDDDYRLLKSGPYTPILVDFAYKRRVFEVMVDLTLAGLAYHAAYVVRFGPAVPEPYLGVMMRSLPVVVGWELLGLFLAGVYRGIWRYITFSDLWTYIKGVAIGSVGAIVSVLYFYRFEDYSRGVFVINAVFFCALVLASRLMVRLLGDVTSAGRAAGQPVLLYGAGEDGILLVRTLHRRFQGQYQAVGFLDDDTSKRGRLIAGLEVLGSIETAETVLERTGTVAVLVSDEIEPNRLGRLQAVCQRGGVTVYRLRTVLEPVDTESGAPGAAPAPADTRASRGDLEVPAGVPGFPVGR